MNFSDKVYEAVKKIPRGKVTTYGDVARAIGCPRSARQVGRALHHNPQPVIIPCHRVVSGDGAICEGFAFGGRDAQKALLESEGVEVSGDYRVNMQRHRFLPQSDGGE